MIKTELPGIKLTYSSATYISLGDLNAIYLSIENSSQVNFVEEITLIFEDPESFVTPAPDQSLSVKVEVPARGKQARQLNFQILKTPIDGFLDYYFQIVSDTSRFETNKEKFQIAPIPYLRSTWAWLFSSAGLGALIIALLWEKIKELIGI